MVKKCFLLDSNDAICLAKSNIISGLKEKNGQGKEKDSSEETIQGGKLFKGGNYSREETINH